MKRSTVRLLLLLVLLVFVVPIAAFAAEGNETPPAEVNNSTPAAVETTPAPASAPAPASGTGSTEGPAPSQQPAATNEPTPAVTPATPTGTTPGETPAAPTGTTPGETPATPTGTTPGETPATPTGTTPGETPATTDGTTPEDKPDAAEEDEENPEPAAEKADVEKAKLAGVKKNGAMLGESMNGEGVLLLGAIPAQPTITAKAEPRNNAVWNGDDWIDGNGFVFIKSGFILTDNGEVRNTSTHQAIDSTNYCIAFIVGQNSTLNFGKTNTVTSSYPSGVAFGWTGSTINIFGKLISANANDNWNKNYYIVKTSGGTIRLGDGATIEDYQNAQFGCVENPDNSQLLVEGTATIKNSSLTVTQKPLELQSGANLVLENSSLTLGEGSGIIVPKEATLTLKGTDSSLSGERITVQAGGKLVLDGASVASSVANFVSGALLELKNNASFQVVDGETLNLGGVEVTRGANNTNTNTITGTGTGTGTLNLLVDNENKEINIGSGAGLKTQNLTIRNAIINDDTYTADGVEHVNTTIIVNDGSTTTLKDSTFTTDHTKEVGSSTPIDGRYYIYVKPGGTLKMTNSIVENKAGSFVAIRAEDNATVDLTNCEFLKNSHPNLPGGAIRGINADITVKGCWFENNTAK